MPCLQNASFWKTDFLWIYMPWILEVKKMKKYASVLVALCALFAFGLVSCKSYSDDDNNAALVAVLNQQSATQGQQQPAKPPLSR